MRTIHANNSLSGRSGSQITATVAVAALHRRPAAAAARCRRSCPLAAAAVPVAASTQAPHAQHDPYAQLAELCGAAGPVAVGHTPRGRGLVVSQDMPEREALLTVPLQNALIISDEPTDGISIFSDKQHRKWQELHGELPPLLLEFLQGEETYR